MTIVEKAVRAEFLRKAIAHVGPHLEAFSANTGADVRVRSSSDRCRIKPTRATRLPIETRDLGKRLTRDARNGAAPSRMRHGERAAWRHDNNWNAIGKAQKRRNVGRTHNDAVSTLAGCVFVCRNGRIIGILDRYQISSVHLIGNDNPHAFRPERAHERSAVRIDRRPIIPHMRSEIELVIGRSAHTAASPRKSDAHAESIGERIVGNHGYSLEAAFRKMRKRQCHRTQNGRDLYRERFRKSGM